MSYCSRKIPITVGEANTMNLDQLNTVLDSCEANCGCYTGCDTVAYMNIRHKELEQDLQNKKNAKIMEFLCEQLNGFNYTFYDDCSFFDFNAKNGGVLTLRCDRQGVIFIERTNIEFKDDDGLSLEEYYERSKKCST